MPELLIGCGQRRKKLMAEDGREEWDGLVTLDINPDHKPDVVHDLTVLPLPFEDNTFDEIHAYEVLEHTGQQGDWRFFFAQFTEFWRILKPGGHFFGTTPGPHSPWGDPGHTRVISHDVITFLSQAEYTKQVGVSPMTDYRFVYQADFDIQYVRTSATAFLFGLEAVKPSRVTR
jgi:SAM-dependent methyltransferase